MESEYRISRIGSASVLKHSLSCNQIYLTDSPRPPCHPHGMDLSKMTLEEVQALLRLLAEFEREELELIMRERREAELTGRLN